MLVPERRETQGMRWADCEDDEGKEEQEQETEREREQEAEGKKEQEQEKEKETREETGQERNHRVLSNGTEASTRRMRKR